MMHTIGTFLAVLAALALWSDWQKRAKAKATLRNAEMVHSLLHPTPHQQKSGHLRPGFRMLGVVVACWIAILGILVS